MEILAECDATPPMRAISPEAAGCKCRLKTGETLRFTYPSAGLTVILVALLINFKFLLLAFPPERNLDSARLLVAIVIGQGVLARKRQ